MRPRQQVATALAAYLASRDANTSRALGPGLTRLCECVARLSEELLEVDTERSSALDGMLPVSVRQQRAGLLTVAGCVIVMDSQNLRPILADLALWPEASTIRLAAVADEAPWSSSGADRVPVPAVWRYRYRFRLPPMLTTEQLAAWSRTGLAELRQLLFWKWDPLGVNDAFPRTAREYDDQASAIFGRLHRGDGQRDIARSLRDAETELLGESRSDHASRERLAAQLIEWYEDSLAFWLEGSSRHGRIPVDAQ